MCSCSQRSPASHRPIIQRQGAFARQSPSVQVQPFSILQAAAQSAGTLQLGMRHAPSMQSHAKAVPHPSWQSAMTWHSAGSATHPPLSQTHPCSWVQALAQSLSPAQEGTTQTPSAHAQAEALPQEVAQLASVVQGGFSQPPATQVHPPGPQTGSQSPFTVHLGFCTHVPPSQVQVAVSGHAAPQSAPAEHSGVFVMAHSPDWQVQS